jgi:hypothetical protein
MLRERRKAVAVSGVWWPGSLGAKTTIEGEYEERLFASSPDLYTKDSGSKRAVVFARFAMYRVDSYTSVESSQIVQTSAPYPSKEGKGNRRGGVSLELIWYLPKVRSA